MAKRGGIRGNIRGDVKKLQGSCHCGAIRFEIKTDPSFVSRCNCSICTKKGSLNHTIPPEQFRLISGEENLTLYQFNTETASHYFCKTCGIHPFSHPRTAPDHYNVNFRCLDGFDLESQELEWRHFDGQNWEEAAKSH